MPLLEEGERTMSLIELKNVDVSFATKGKKKGMVGALVGMNLSIEEGEIIAVVGESGCGKTTLGKVITDIYKPTEGEIQYYGKDIRKLSKKEYEEYRLGVQMVHQDSYAALNPNKTIAQSLILPLLRHKIARNSNEALQILFEYFDEVGLNPPEMFLEKYPHQLSGGQRQRVLLARALSVKPRLIVADEPVSMVDVSMRISLLNLMAKMNQKYKISFVYITHDLGTARYIAAHGKIMVMYLGRLIESNKIQEAISNPMHPYFQALVSAVPEADPSRRSEYVKKLPLRSLDMPDLLNLPKGCKFHPRCPYYTDLCMQEEPKLRELNGGIVACHHVEAIKKG
jgi:peptide/nickel transport system ATP-binding protein